MKTILVTGCSSGFGAEIARTFLDRGWKVIATMRTPRPDLLPESANLTIVPLDLTDPQSIAALPDRVGPIDALVNNAGQGMVGVLEAVPMAAIRSIFETNTLGLMALTQALLPQLRATGGVLVNVSSSTTFVPLPMLSVYTASKAAVEAFTRSLALELGAVGVRAHLVIPGRSPETGFRNNARRIPDMPDAYAEFARSVFARMGSDSGEVTHLGDVAEAVWQAVTDADAPMDLPAGADAQALASAA